MNVLERIFTIHRLVRCRWQTERSEMSVLRERQYRSGSVFDIGAYRGVHSYWMHRWFCDETRIVAFEPQPELARFLEDFKASYCLDRLMVMPVGVSSRCGMQRMRRPAAYWSKATFDEFCDDNAECESLDVPVTTIDNYVAEHPELQPVRFIKCDVEHYETEVLAGAERTLREDRPELLVEWSTPRRSYRERLFRLAQRLDYAIYQFEYGRLTPCTSAERHSPPSWELGAHYLFLPREQTASAAA